MRRDENPSPRLKLSYVIAGLLGVVLVISAITWCSMATSVAPRVTRSSSLTKTSHLTKGSLVVNVNEATLEELQTLPGVGPARAKLIVQNRPYETVDDLAQRHSLPQSVVTENRDRLKTTGKTEQTQKR